MNEMSKQMELFDEGGLMQEGGTVDPISGNDVPVGSTQEEVRDDIPAQLSEGEFVMPADVVRYHGLDKMMSLRDEAKMGLQRMDDMGQMGNSEEAVIPDGVPFDMNDLDIEDDGEPQEFNLGGVVQAPGTGIGGYTAPSIPTTGYTPPPIGVAAAPVAPSSQSQIAFTPTTAATNIPTFGQFVGTGGGKYDELVTYVNDAGQIMQIPHVNGKPIYPVPEGFKRQEKPTDTAPESPLVDTTTQQPQQQDNGGGRDDMTPEERETERQTFADISKRKDAAAKLGYTNQIGAFEHMAGALLPGVSMMNKYDAGDVMPDGTISDGSGNTFDPITGERKSVSGGILGNVANEIAGIFGGGTKAEDAKISPAAKAMGLSPASMAGLMTISGNQSINQAIGKPTLAGGMPPSIDETAKVETTLGQAAVTKEAKADKPATVSEAASLDITPDNILESIGLKDADAQAAFQQKGGSFKVSDSGIVQTIMPGIGIRGGDVITSYSPTGTFIRQDTSATAEGTTKGTYSIKGISTTPATVDKPTTDELTFRNIESRQADLNKTQDLVRSAVQTSRRTPAQQTQDLVSSAARSSTRDRSKPSVQDTITKEMSSKSGYNKSFERDIKAGKYDSAFAARDAFSRDVAAEISRSEKAEIASAKSEGRAANVGSRPAASGEVSDSRGNVVRSSDGSPVTSSGPKSSAKGLAIAAEREQRESDNSTDSRVICTELYKQGKLSRDLYRMDVLYTARDLPDTLVRGYHYWAIPMVPVIRRNKLVCNIFEYLTIKRAEEIAHIVDPINHTKTTITGKIIKNVGEAICYAIGLFVKQKDYTVLYNEKSV